MDSRNLFLFLGIIIVMTLSTNSPKQGSLNDDQAILDYLLKAKKFQESGYILQKSLQDLVINYTDHEPIYIDGNTHFRATVTAENWLGDGSESTPYVIDRLRIIGPRSKNLIEIRNTDVHFQINNSILSGGNGGISLSNVKNGIISYNNINNNFNGIFLNYSTNNIISWDTITHNGLEGIFLDSSGNNSVFNNIITYNIWTGIELWDSGSSDLSGNLVANNFGLGMILGRSGSCIISSNNVSYNRFTGISLLDLAGSTMYENFVSNNSLNGVSLGNVSNTHIFNNIVLKNKWYGIRLYDSGSNILTNNTLSCNYKYGILLESSSKDNKVIQNDFIRNHGANSSQAFDDGQNNEFMFNYWDDWTSPDTNADGVVDFSYQIDGKAGNQDPHPLVSRFFVISRTSDAIMLSSNTIAGLILLSITLCALIVLIVKQKPT